MEIEYYHVDPESYNFAILRNINSESYLRSSTVKKHNILITHDINIYRNARPQDLDNIVAKYSNLWIDINRTIDVPEDIWIHIRLKENADSENAKLLYKSYKILFNERVIINTALNKLYSQGKFEWITKSTFYIFPVFIVWRTLYKDGISIRKGRAIVDIREFNRAVISDTYFIFL
jgi:hypothetical protein